MSFFDKFTRDENSADDVGYIPMSTLMRWYLYDMDVVDREELAQKFELPPISQEGIEMEILDSKARMAVVEKYTDFVKGLAEINGYIINEIHSATLREKLELLRDEFGDDVDDMYEELTEETTIFFDQISFAAIMFGLSVGFAVGLLSEGPAEVNYAGENPYEQQ